MDKEMIDKLLSRRLWLTVIAGAVFAYATAANIINADVVGTVIVMVFTLYFQRNDRNGGKPV